MGADDDAGKAKREDNAQATLREGMPALVERMLPKMFGATTPNAIRERVRKMFLENDPTGSAASLRGMAQRPDSKNILARFGNPALVLVGEQDALTPPEKSRAMAEVLSRSSIQTLAEAGHLSNLENAKAFNEALNAFLSKL
jgi:pimeloyl-ACP methyl ester carboxylesterase